MLLKSSRRMTTDSPSTVGETSTRRSRVLPCGKLRRTRLDWKLPTLLASNRVREFLRANAFKRGAELGKRRVGCLRVRRVCFYEKIDVPGKTWLPHER